MKKILIGITLVILMAMALAAMTKPERTAHYDMLKKGLTVVIGKVVDSPWEPSSIRICSSQYPSVSSGRFG